MQTKKRKPSFKIKQEQFGFEIWSQIASEHKLTQDHIGRKVWVAGEFSTKDRVLKAVHKKGEKSWPNGGYEVLETDRGIVRYYPLQKCRLHPKELKKKRNARKILASDTK